MSSSKKVLVCCNPLLDISSNVDASFMEKYKLQPGNAILADEKLHDAHFFKDLEAQEGTLFVPGGSGMNTARVCSWIKQAPREVSYLGAVGKDAYATTMLTQAAKDGVNVDGMLVVEDGTPTGLCGVCITNKERSLVASLGAANKFTHGHLEKENVKSLMNEAEIVYMTGFCLTVDQKAVFDIASLCATTKKVLAINISAPFIVAVFKEQLLKLLSYSDIIFCNETEAKCLAGALEIAEDLSYEEIAQAILAKNVLKQGGKQMIVFTCGKEPTVVVCKEMTTSIPVKTVPEDSIVDTNGAGDAFVGGFLAMYAKDAPIAECVTTGNYAAGVIIQHSGCQFPAQPAPPQ